MKFICIGKYVNTHGINGEIKILSDFSRKDLIFIKEFKMYINNYEYIINSYRRHKNYDMVTFVGINSINDIEHLKGSMVYINEHDLNIDYLDEYLINYIVIIDDEKYKIKNILENKSNKILVLENNKMIPYVEDFIIKKDDIKKEIYIKNLEGLL